MKIYVLWNRATVGKMHRIEPWDTLNDLVLYMPRAWWYAVIDAADP